MSLPSDNPLLHARELTYAYGRTPALRGLSLAVGEGECVAVVGPMKSGTSTLLHCVAGLLRPTGGELWIIGEPVHTLDEQSRARLRRRSFGIVYQTDRLLPELTVAENIALPMYLRGISRAEASARTTRWLARLELGELAGRHPAELSLGERRRVAIARAVASEPRLLLADEPTAALDEDETHHTLRMLRSATLSHGMTLLVTSHDPRVLGYVDRFERIIDGRVAHDDLVGVS